MRHWPRSCWELEAARRERIRNMSDDRLDEERVVWLTLPTEKDAIELMDLVREWLHAMKEPLIQPESGDRPAFVRRQGTET